MTDIIHGKFVRIVSELGGEKRGENEFLCKCPAHDDRSPSLKVDLRNGKILFRCYADCSQEEVLKALSMRGLWNNETDGGPRRTPPGIPLVWPSARMLKVNNLLPGPETQRQYVEHWSWKNAAGGIEGITALYFGRGKKDVIPFFKRWNDREWRSGFEKEKARPLYARDVMARHPEAEVWIVEGERKAETLIGKKRVATTWPGGAKSWSKADFSCLKGRSVVLWPDKDRPGKSAMNGIAKFLESLDCSIRIVNVDEIPELSESEDVVDWFLKGKTEAELDSLPFFGGSKKKTEQISGKTEENSENSDENDETDGVPGKDRPYDEYEAFFVEKLGPAKKDIFSGDVMTYDPEDRLWLPIDTDANLSYLRSLARAESKRRLRLASIKDHFLGRYLRTKEKEFIPEIPEWDGVDHIRLFADACEIKNVSGECFYEYLCQWGALMIGRIFNPFIQNQIMILQGEEGAGKSTFIYALTRGCGQWATNFTVHVQEKDNYEQVASSAVLILDEFERLTKHEQGLIKNLITTPKQRYRPSHERKLQTKMMRASWISTTNLDEILKSSGKNRRFIIFELSKIRWDYPQDSSLQIMAQWKRLAEQQYRVSDDSRAEMEGYIARKTPAAFWDEVVGEVLERVELLRTSGERDPSQTTFSSEELDKVFERVQKEYQVRPQRLKKELKERGFDKVFRRGLKLFRGWEFPIVQDDGDKLLNQCKVENSCGNFSGQNGFQPHIESDVYGWSEEDLPF